MTPLLRKSGSGAVQLSGLRGGPLPSTFGFGTPPRRSICAQSNRWNDTLLILVVLVLESAFELTAFSRHPRPESSSGAPRRAAELRDFFIGTVLPTMVLIYAILLPATSH